MTLFIRSIQVILLSFFRPKLRSTDEVVVMKFRVLPIDLDIYFHMNSAKYMNYMEASRWEIQVRTGFFIGGLKRRWIAPLSQVHIQYFRPLKLFQKFEVHSRAILMEEKWFYVLQQFFSNGKEVARGLVKGSVRKGRDNIPPSEYLSAVGYPNTEVQLSDEISAWIKESKI